MFPAMMVAVSTERMVAMPASVMATSTMSAMIRIVPPSRARPWCRGKRSFLMSARLPDPVAQWNRGLEDAVPVAGPVVQRRGVRVAGRGQVEARVVPQRVDAVIRSGPPRLVRRRVADGGKALRGLFGQRA